MRSRARTTFPRSRSRRCTRRRPAIRSGPRAWARPAAPRSRRPWSTRPSTRWRRSASRTSTCRSRRRSSGARCRGETVPELPDVDAARLLVGRVARGRRIVAAECVDDRIVYDGVEPEAFCHALVGRRVVAVHRRGKHLWLELDRRPWPSFHFGMTGGFHVPGRGARKLRSSRVKPRGGEWPPRFTKLRLVFDDGGELALADARRLGRIRLREDPAGEPPISVLGFDALLDLPSARRLRELLAGRSAPIKAILLDQSFSAGVGNWIAAEVLYQAGIDPRRRGRSLSAAEVSRLRARLRSVMTAAVKVRSDSRRFPRWWLFHARWDRDVSVRGERLRRATIGGRTTAWAPAVQR